MLSREDRKLMKILFTKDSVLTRIGRDAFSECVSLEKILLPGTVTEVDDRAFYRCKSLKTVRFPEGLKRIGKEALLLRNGDAGAAGVSGNIG